MGARLPFSAARVGFSLLALTLSLGLDTDLSSAQVVLNELLPNPVGDDVGTERIEIVNVGATPVDVTGWAIDDAATIDQAAVRCRLPEDFDGASCSLSPILQPGEFRLVKGTTTAAFLNNTGDDVYLIKDRTITPVVADVVTYPSASTHVGESWAAIPNGSDSFDWRTQSFCASNGGAGDFIAPAAITDFAAAPGEFPGEVRLTWTAPGDDGMVGTAAAYVIKTSLVAINSGTFDAATDINFWVNEPLPAAAASPETLYVFGLDPGVEVFFAIKAIDDASNVGGISNLPSAIATVGSLLDANLGYTAYFGNLHSHTGFSDGVQTPTDAYAFARTNGLDYLAVTDHNHSAAGMSLPNYAVGLSQAAAANDDGQFVAIYGQEWGLSSNGHANIFESPALFGWEPGNYNVFVEEGDYVSLYSAVASNPPVGFPPIIQWCHPAPSDFQNFSVTADGLATVHLICLVHGPPFSTKTDESDIGNTGYDDVYQEALRKGFRVSPTGDQDNHEATWGMSTQSRTAVLANSKTKLSILTGLSEGRNYATQDHNTAIQISADGHAMGEAFSSENGIRIAMQMTDPDGGEGVATVELYSGVTGTSNATLIASSSGNPDFQWRELRTFPEGTEVHYYLRIRQADNQQIWTAPIYVTYEPTSGVADSGPSGRSRLFLAPPVPNPTSGRTEISFALAHGTGAGGLVLYDANGREMRTLHNGPLTAGEHHRTWDGRLDDGTQAPQGIYFLQLEAAGIGTRATKVILVR